MRSSTHALLLTLGLLLMAFVSLGVQPLKLKSRLRRHVPASFLQLSQRAEVVASAQSTARASVQKELSKLYYGEKIEGTEQARELAIGDVLRRDYVYDPSDKKPPRAFLHGAVDESGKPIKGDPVDKAKLSHYVVVVGRYFYIRSLFILVVPFDPKSGYTLPEYAFHSVDISDSEQNWLAGYNFVGRLDRPAFVKSFIRRTVLDELDINNDPKRLLGSRFFRTARAHVQSDKQLLEKLDENDKLWWKEAMNEAGFSGWISHLQARYKGAADKAELRLKKDFKGAAVPPVIVSGAGPAGLTTALLLAVTGIDFHLLDARCSYIRQHIVSAAPQSSMNEQMTAQFNSIGLERDQLVELAQVLYRTYGDSEPISILIGDDKEIPFPGFGMTNVLFLCGVVAPKLIDKEIKIKNAEADSIDKVTGVFKDIDLLFSVASKLDPSSSTPETEVETFRKVWSGRKDVRVGAIDTKTDLGATLSIINDNAKAINTNANQYKRKDVNLKDLLQSIKDSVGVLASAIKDLKVLREKLKTTKTVTEVVVAVNDAFSDILAEPSERFPAVPSLVISDLEKLLYTTLLLLLPQDKLDSIHIHGCDHQQPFSQIRVSNVVSAGFVKPTKGTTVSAWKKGLEGRNQNKRGALYSDLLSKETTSVIVHAEGGSSFFREDTKKEEFAKVFTPLSKRFDSFLVKDPDLEVSCKPMLDWSATFGSVELKELIPPGFKLNDCGPKRLSDPDENACDPADNTPLIWRDFAPMYLMMVFEDPGLKKCKIKPDVLDEAAQEAKNIAMSPTLNYIGKFELKSPHLNKCQVELGVRPAYVPILNSLFPKGFRWPHTSRQEKDFHLRAKLLLNIFNSMTSFEEPVSLNHVLELKVWSSAYSYTGIQTDDEVVPLSSAEDPDGHIHVLLGDAARDPFTTFAMGINDAAFSSMLFVKSLLDGTNTRSYNVAARRVVLINRFIHKEIEVRIKDGSNVKARSSAGNVNHCASFVNGLCLEITDQHVLGVSWA